MPGNRLWISGFFCIWLAMLLLTLPLRWLFAVLIAASVHEGCHALAVRLCGGRVRFFTANSYGAVMYATELTSGRALLCALAGPVGGLCLLWLAPVFPRTALCAGFQSLYNLLPVEPLDGGNALRLTAQMLFPQYADRICFVIALTVLGSICLLALYGALILHLGWVPLLIAGGIVCRWKKHLAMRSETGYNDLNEHKGASLCQNY